MTTQLSPIPRDWWQRNVEAAERTTLRPPYRVPPGQQDYDCFYASAEAACGYWYDFPTLRQLEDALATIVPWWDHETMVPPLPEGWRPFEHFGFRPVFLAADPWLWWQTVNDVEKSAPVVWVRWRRPGQVFKHAMVVEVAGPSMVGLFDPRWGHSYIAPWRDFVGGRGEFTLHPDRVCYYFEPLV